MVNSEALHRALFDIEEPLLKIKEAITTLEVIAGSDQASGQLDVVLQLIARDAKYSVEELDTAWHEALAAYRDDDKSPLTAADATPAAATH